MDCFTYHPPYPLTKMSRLWILHIHYEIIECNPSYNDLCTLLQHQMSENQDFLISSLIYEAEEENIRIGMKTYWESNFKTEVRPVRPSMRQEGRASPNSTPRPSMSTASMMCCSYFRLSIPKPDAWLSGILYQVFGGVFCGGKTS